MHQGYVRSGALGMKPRSSENSVGLRERGEVTCICLHQMFLCWSSNSVPVCAIPKLVRAESQLIC